MCDIVNVKLIRFWLEHKCNEIYHAINERVLETNFVPFTQQNYRYQEEILAWVLDGFIQFITPHNSQFNLVARHHPHHHPIDFYPSQLEFLIHINYYKLLRPANFRCPQKRSRKSQVFVINSDRLNTSYELFKLRSCRVKFHLKRIHFKPHDLCDIAADEIDFERILNYRSVDFD